MSLYQILFTELLEVLHEEELLRLRKRFEMRQNPGMAEVVTEELERREKLVRENRPV